MGTCGDGPEKAAIIAVHKLPDVAQVIMPAHRMPFNAPRLQHSFASDHQQEECACDKKSFLGVEQSDGISNKPHGCKVLLCRCMDESDPHWGTSYVDVTTVLKCCPCRVQTW